MKPVKKLPPDRPECLVLEIGAEEIPAAYIEPAARQFADAVGQLLGEKNIRHESVGYCHTPRRLSVIISGVAAKADDKTEEFIGPSTAAGRKSDGSFGAPAVGFAAKLGLKPEQLSVKKLAKGDYFSAEIRVPGRKTPEILAENLAAAVSSLKFPKSMTWNDSKFRFARPIRNILALYGNKTVKFEAAGVRSSGKSFGLGPGFGVKISVGGAAKYQAALKNVCVLVDHNERRKTLLRAVEAAARAAGGAPELDGELVEEVNSLVEYPAAVAGKFDARYLALPEEILVTCMKKKQKFFALRGPDGALMPGFIGVKNGISSGVEKIKSGYEKVLAARLEDALFFYNNDMKTGPDAMAKKLSGITFREKLGTMADKAERVKNLAVSFAATHNLDDKTLKDIARGAALAKADLTSEMIFEYPELAGIAGAVYAAKAGEAPAVCAVIREHYYPLAGDETELPSGLPAALTAIADRADTIAADFYLGMIPTGSEDPCGLRRAAAGILRILLDEKLAKEGLRLELSRIFSEAAGQIETENAKRPEELRELLEKIRFFLKQRLETIFLDKGFSTDEIRAALAPGFDDLADAAARIKALAAAKKDPAFGAMAISLKRAANIIKQAAKSSPDGVGRNAPPDAALFAETQEKELSSKIDVLESELKNSAGRGDYLSALKLLAGLGQALEEFFNKVMVMSPDEKLRRNRLALLKRITDLYAPVADFSELQN